VEDREPARPETAVAGGGRQPCRKGRGPETLETLANFPLDDGAGVCKSASSLIFRNLDCGSKGTRVGFSALSDLGRVLSTTVIETRKRSTVPRTRERYVSMKKIHILGLALFAVFAFGAVAASASFGAEVPQWLVSGATIALGTEVKTTLEMEAGNLLLIEDMKAPGTPDFLCEVAKATGVLLSNGAGRQTTWECVKLVDDKSTCAAGSIVFKPLHLPWTTQLLSTSEDGITAGTGGAPGWEVKCTVIGIPVTDTCETTSGKTLLSTTEDGLIDVEFMESITAAEEVACSLTKEKSGLVVGLSFLHASNAAGELVPVTTSLAAEVV